MKPEPVCGTEDAADPGAIVFHGPGHLPGSIIYRWLIAAL